MGPPEKVVRTRNWLLACTVCLAIGFLYATAVIDSAPPQLHTCFECGTPVDAEASVLHEACASHRLEEANEPAAPDEGGGA